MHPPVIQEILPLVQLPSRYLGCEINRTQKSWEKTSLHIALAFPDLYEIGTSHFGLQILYAVLNARQEILAERVFAPAADMEQQLRQRGQRLFSLESQTPINQFDIVGFSLLYELNYTNVVNMLDLAGISLLAAKREAHEPFVIAGGPCTCNPEPVSAFFDAMVVGDGETVVLQLTEAWEMWRAAGRPNRDGLLQRWSKIKGVYIPAFFEACEDPDGNPGIAPKMSGYAAVERAVISDLNQVPVPSKPIVPFGRPIHDRLRMEIARGCTRGCRFCQAGMIYRPVRERLPESILSSSARLLAETGYEDLSLLSLSTGDYSCLEPLLRRIVALGQKDRTTVSLPSLRAGSISTELIDILKKGRKTGFTFAPEAGTQRLRNVINKDISEADIFETVEMAFAHGWKVLKLYFMIGLPTETWCDIEAIAVLVKRLAQRVSAQGRRGRIHVSVATFVPKPHTPFQWEPQIGIEAAVEKINWLKNHLNLPGVQMKWQDPRVSLVEGVWARGDRKLNSVLIHAWKLGCRFDGWSDAFNFNRWLTAFKISGIDPDRYTRAAFSTSQPLPWDHIQTGVTRSFLVQERALAIKETITTDCRYGACTGCGVCDWDRLKPVVFHDRRALQQPSPIGEGCNLKNGAHTYLMAFKKMGHVRFLGHLEMVNVFIRSLRRAKFPLKYSNGFHPMPKVAFADTLPMGMQSEHEQLLLTLTERIDPAALVGRLQPQMPNGLEIVSCALQTEPVRLPKEAQFEYHVALTQGVFDRTHVDWLAAQPSLTIHRKNKKGNPVRIDLKKAIVKIQLLDPCLAVMTLGKDANQVVRPALVMDAVFKLRDTQIRSAIITKRQHRHV